MIARAASWVAGVALALLCGALLALGGKLFALLLLGILLCGAMLALPWAWLVAAQLVAVFALVGPLQYMAGVQKAFWLPYLMSVVIGARVLMDPQMQAGVFAARAPASPSTTPSCTADIGRWMHAGLALMGLSLLALVASSLAARTAPMQWIVAGKEVFFLWSLPAALALGRPDLQSLRPLWKWTTAWLLLQLPVVAWQRWVVAPRRMGDSPWDAVVGLFAGSALGGGGSGSMALVSLWAAAMVVMAWRLKQAPAAAAAAALLAALAACAMAEVKIAALLLPLLALCILALPLRLPRGAVVGAPLAALALSAALLWAYQAQFTSWRSAEGQSALRYAQTSLERNVDASVQADPYGQLTRLGSLAYWWQRQSAVDVPGWLIGHGLGSVRHTRWSEDAAVNRPRFNAARSSAAILLWESGVLGLLAWVGSGLAWMVAAWRLARRPEHQRDAWLPMSAFTILALTLLSLPYGADLFEAPQLATAHLLGVGLVMAAWRRTRLGLSGTEPKAAA